LILQVGKLTQLQDSEKKLLEKKKYLLPSLLQQQTLLNLKPLHELIADMYATIGVHADIKVFEIGTLQ
jgi:hypothetical protein